MYKAAGAITDEELLTFRKFGSRLEGHPIPVLPWVDVATGSLGQGLPYGVGIALAGKRLDRLPYRIWVLCGDSEMAEGSMWEAFEHAWHEKLDNLIAIIDVNRLGQRGETMHGWDLDSYAKRAEAFGWHAIEIDGHDVEAIDAAYAEALETSGTPTVIVARTIKGKGVKAVENKDGFHGKALDDPEAAIEELGGIRNITIDVAKPELDGEPHRFEHGTLELPSYEVGDDVATRKAYGDTLKALGDGRGDVVALDGEVSNSTFAEIFRDAHPDRYFEMYIAEQQMVAAAVGIQVRGWKPYASTFAAFLTPGVRLRPDGGDQPRESEAGRLACGSLDRRGRAVPDGARGSRRLPGGARLDRAVPERREPDGEARRGHGRPGRDRLPAHHPGEHAGDLRSRRGLPGRWGQGRALLGRATTSR